MTSTLHDVGHIHLFEPRFSTWDKKPWDGLPWSSRGWESTCQCRRHGLNPWSRRITHTTGQPGPYATTTELSHCRARIPQLLKPRHLGLVRRNKRRHCHEGKKTQKNKWISEMFGVWATCGGSHCKFLARGSRKMSCLEKTFQGTWSFVLQCGLLSSSIRIIGDLVRCRPSSPVSDPLNQILKCFACMLKFEKHWRARGWGQSRRLLEHFWCKVLDSEKKWRGKKKMNPAGYFGWFYPGWGHSVKNWPLRNGLITKIANTGRYEV